MSSILICWSAVIAALAVGVALALNGIRRRDNSTFSKGLVILGALGLYIGILLLSILVWHDTLQVEAWVVVGLVIGLGTAGVATGILGLIKKGFFWPVPAKGPGTQEKF